MEDKLEARFQELEEKLKNLTQEDRARVRDAFDYARSHHEGQLRKDGSPYITHPLVPISQLFFSMRSNKYEI